MIAGGVKDYSLGGLWVVPGDSKIALGEVRGPPGGGLEGGKIASGGVKLPKSA